MVGKPQVVRTFEISLDSGPAAVDLPTSWALDVDEVRVSLENSAELGWRATLVSGRTPILGFPWVDHVDRVLLEGSEEIPTTAPEVEWDDLEQCWWASIHRDGDHLLLAEGDFGELCDRMTAAPVLVAPGHVDVGGTEVLWHRVRADDYDAAWGVARQFFLYRT